MDLTEISFTRFLPKDVDLMVEYLQEKSIHNMLATLPYPYERQHAASWITFTNDRAKKYGKQTDWAIRYKGNCIGAIGLRDPYVERFHRNMIGYWLAKPFWGKGIMSFTLNQFSDFCFQELAYDRIDAHVLTNNLGSCKVLEKAGYTKEGLLRKYQKRGNQLDDLFIYAKLHPKYDK